MREEIEIFRSGAPASHPVTSPASCEAEEVEARKKKHEGMGRVGAKFSESAVGTSTSSAGDLDGHALLEKLSVQIQDKIQEQIEKILGEVTTSTAKDESTSALVEIRQEVHSAKIAAENASLSARQAAQELALARGGVTTTGVHTPSPAFQPAPVTPAVGNPDLEDLKREVQALKMSATKAAPGVPNSGMPPAGPCGVSLPKQHLASTSAAPQPANLQPPPGSATTSYWASPYHQAEPDGPAGASTYQPSLPYMGKIPRGGVPPPHWAPGGYGSPFVSDTPEAWFEQPSASGDMQLPSFRSPAGFDADVRSSAGLSDAARRVLSIKERISELHAQPSEGATDNAAARKKPKRRSQAGPVEDPARPSLRGINRRMDILGQARRNLDTAYLDLGPPGQGLMPRVWK